MFVTYKYNLVRLIKDNNDKNKPVKTVASACRDLKQPVAAVHIVK